MHIRNALWTIVSGAMIAGCASSGRELKRIDQIPTIPRGATLEAVERQLEHPLQFEFAVLDQGREYHSVSFWACSVRFYFVFREGALVSIIEPPPFEYEEYRDFRGTGYSARKTGYVAGRLRATLGAADMTSDQLQQSINRQYSPDHPAEMFNNLWPLPFIMAPIQFVMLPRSIAMEKEYREIQARFHPRRVKLGMSRDEVIDVYGAALNWLPAGDGREIRIYGPMSVRSSLRIAVAFRDGRAEGAFMHDFFDPYWNPGERERVERLRRR